MEFSRTLAVAHQRHGKLSEAMAREDVVEDLMALLVHHVYQEETLAIAEQEETRTAKVVGSPYRHRPRVLVRDSIVVADYR